VGWGVGRPWGGVCVCVGGGGAGCCTSSIPTSTQAVQPHQQCEVANLMVLVSSTDTVSMARRTCRLPLRVVAYGSHGSRM
jgi:hypothetical protein